VPLARSKDRTKGHKGPWVRFAKPLTIGAITTMFHILRRNEQRKGAIAAVEFEGEPYGAGVSFLLGDLPPGAGPSLHAHPYAEICIVRSGEVAMTVDGREIIVGPGDILVTGPEISHSFVAIGEERLDMVGIHVNGRFIIQRLNLQLNVTCLFNDFPIRVLSDDFPVLPERIEVAPVNLHLDTLRGRPSQ
jgi:quercetin dioxygenase-like cupin family protein